MRRRGHPPDRWVHGRGWGEGVGVRGRGLGGFCGSSGVTGVGTQYCELLRDGFPLP